MKEVIIALSLSFTAPGADHYSPDFDLVKLGEFASTAGCDNALIQPYGLRIDGGTETPDMRILREGVCLKGVPESDAKASMLIEGVARVPRIHAHYYKAIVLQNFADMTQCNRTSAKLAALLPKNGAGEVVDIFTTCYAAR